MIQLETDSEMIFGEEDDNEVFHSFTAQDIAAASANINRLTE